jgi:nitronate monooxygenase
MREAAVKADNLSAMQAWAGQSAMLAGPEPAGDLVARLWRDAQDLLG